MAAKGSQKATEASPAATSGYYDALTAAWNNPTQPPPGVTGAGLVAGDTTDQKIVKVNAWTIVGTVPTSFYTTGSEMANCIEWSEMAALTIDQRRDLLQLCSINGPMVGGSAMAHLLSGGMFVAYFGVQSKTIANLTALAKAVVRPWWSTPVAEGGGGLTGVVSRADTTAAGLV
jgi:hypothetical protein